MKNYGRILIIQTAFIGDVILTLPLVQVLKKHFPDAVIDFLCIPATEGILKNNPLIGDVIVYDKRNTGLRELFSLIGSLKRREYDLILSPHRSFRSSLISRFSSVSKTISFDKSSLDFLYDMRVPYIRDLHEIQRNLRLLNPIGITEDSIVRPELYPSDSDRSRISSLLTENGIGERDRILSIAPGSVWFTKRYPKEKFAELCNKLSDRYSAIMLIGGESDKEICSYIAENSRSVRTINNAGKLSILESAVLIGRSSVLITNDSAPLHIGNAMNTKVFALFGSTIPAFGFYPYGKEDRIFETENLKCRPCSIHGRKSCPEVNFFCMEKIEASAIADAVNALSA